MPSRKRARSDSLECRRPSKRLVRALSDAGDGASTHTSPPLLLTHENLERWTAATFAPNPLRAMSRPPSPSRSNVDDLDKLAAYRVLIDRGDDRPAALQAHIATHICPEPLAEATSPAALKAVRKRRLASRQNERSGIRMMEPFLLFRGEVQVDDDDDDAAVPLIFSKDEANLDRAYLPPAPNEMVKKTQGPLSQPRADTIVGYVTIQDAESRQPPGQSAFSASEEAALTGYRLTPNVHLPFLSSQWKSPASDQHPSRAYNQSGRDGAAVVNHLHDFYIVAYPHREPTVVETCHYSLTCDLHYAQIWVHWRQQGALAVPDHHMELVEEFSMRKEADVRKARTVLRNILDYALGPRLQSLKAALPSFATNRVYRGGTSTTGPGSETSLPMLHLPLTPSETLFRTPEETAKEPSKKRRIEEVEGEKQDVRT
ncbi:hypothetical protein BU26DRAFT_525225 [Trematosphaeria pertusa]|uniref:DUF7924 domain-containing protein n=1 Tax=Trematosphaeria pertusa TaxID=390896 RepID=A0A6A6HVF0_9PLEO|nr:uncharacterized protein BU26DRAFT_525225 [Trematosphaeria pertusa]KAF2241400.1 hypothetical protein BU26DRAFT_525225 [Trematosphaeria pertusa]